MELYNVASESGPYNLSHLSHAHGCTYGSLFLCIADCKNIFHVCTDPSDTEVQGILMKPPYSHFQGKGTSRFPLCTERLGTGLSATVRWAAGRVQTRWLETRLHPCLSLALWSEQGGVNMLPPLLCTPRQLQTGNGVRHLVPLRAMLH